ncbi:DUF5320 domain-containing protein [Desulfonatronovibrio hydrogenovorans]|uniref:DUF5320 domain-containing protein n=1 Tax=Desulfonatronovibrio hydrogenovorans TaxID=53245 RepID=UPI001378CD9A
MPGKDRTGPLGKGPKTGLREGFCGKKMENDRDFPDRPARRQEKSAHARCRGQGRAAGQGFRDTRMSN